MSKSGLVLQRKQLYNAADMLTLRWRPAVESIYKFHPTCCWRLSIKPK